MEKARLGVLNIIFGFLFSVVFLPIFFALPIIAGNVWNVSNEVLQKDAVFARIEEQELYGKLRNLMIEAVDEEISEYKALFGDVVGDIITEELIKSIFENIYDVVVYANDEARFSEEFSETLSKTLYKAYSKNVQALFDQCFEDYLAGKEKAFIFVENDVIDDALVEMVAEKTGINESLVSKKIVVEFFKVRKLSDKEKQEIIETFDPEVKRYIDIYSEEIADEFQIKIDELIIEVNETENIDIAREVFSFVTENIMVFVGVCAAIFAVLMILLMLVLKARMASFVVPAISLILAGLVFVAEYLGMVWVSNNFAKEVVIEAGAEGEIQKCAIGFVESVMGDLSKMTLYMGAGVFALAIIFIVLGNIIKAIRNR